VSVAITGTHSADFRIASTDCAGRRLGSDETCSVNIVADLTAVGARAAELVVSAHGAADLRIPLSASGLALPALPAPRDVAAPQLSLAIPQQRLASVLRRGLKVRIGCSEPCRLQARLNATAALTRRLKLPRAKLLGATTARLGTPGTRQINVKLTAQARRALRQVRTASLKLTVVATDAAGNDRTRHRTVRLTR
ncbi:MAG TPA: hypothetical protein VF230_14165, partial [Acidimicrobiales bacterium]